MKYLCVFKWLFYYWICHSTVQGILKEPGTFSVKLQTPKNLTAVATQWEFQAPQNTTNSTINDFNTSLFGMNLTKSHNPLHDFVNHLATFLKTTQNFSKENPSGLRLEKELLTFLETNYYDKNLVSHLLSNQHLLQTYLSGSSSSSSLRKSRQRRGVIDHCSRVLLIDGDWQKDGTIIRYKYSSPSVATTAIYMDAPVPKFDKWRPYPNITVLQSRYPYHNMGYTKTLPCIESEVIVSIVDEFLSTRAATLSRSPLHDDSLDMHNMPTTYERNYPGMPTVVGPTLANGMATDPVVDYYSAEFLTKYCCLKRNWLYYSYIYVFGKHLLLSDEEARYAAYLINRRQIPKNETFDVDNYGVLGTNLRYSMSLEENQRRMNQYFGRDFGNEMNNLRGRDFLGDKGYSMLNHRIFRPNIWRNEDEPIPEYSCD